MVNWIIHSTARRLNPAKVWQPFIISYHISYLSYACLIGFLAVHLLDHECNVQTKLFIYFNRKNNVLWFIEHHFDYMQKQVSFVKMFLTSLCFLSEIIRLEVKGGGVFIWDLLTQRVAVEALKPE